MTTNLMGQVFCGLLFLLAVLGTMALAKWMRSGKLVLLTGLLMMVTISALTAVLLFPKGRSASNADTTPVVGDAAIAENDMRGVVVVIKDMSGVRYWWVVRARDVRISGSTVYFPYINETVAFDAICAVNSVVELRSVVRRYDLDSAAMMKARP